MLFGGCCGPCLLTSFDACERSRGRHFFFFFFFAVPRAFLPMAAWSLKIAWTCFLLMVVYTSGGTCSVPVLLPRSTTSPRNASASECMWIPMWSDLQSSCLSIGGLQISSLTGWPTMALPWTRAVSSSYTLTPGRRMDPRRASRQVWSCLLQD